MNPITIKQEPFWGQNAISNQQTTNDINEFIARQGISINLQPYLKFDTDNVHVKRDNTLTTDSIVIKPDPGLMEEAKQQIIDSLQDPIQLNQMNQPQQSQQQSIQMQITNGQSQINQSNSTVQVTGNAMETKVELDANGKVKKKRKYKKKPPKPKPPKPGQGIQSQTQCIISIQLLIQFSFDFFSSYSDCFGWNDFVLLPGMSNGLC